jgi:GNAT superfamily N-acetyltransferase
MTGIAIRPWQLSDEDAIKRLILDCLHETSYDGLVLAPTEENVEWLWKTGLAWSERGEPTFVAAFGPIDIGYVLWGESSPRGWFNRRVCYGWGTYVIPVWRRHGVASALREKALKVARERGYDCVVGTAFSPVGLGSSLHDGFRIVGQHVEYRLK